MTKKADQESRYWLTEKGIAAADQIRAEEAAEKGDES